MSAGNVMHFSRTFIAGRTLLCSSVMRDLFINTTYTRGRSQSAGQFCTHFIYQPLFVKGVRVKAFGRCVVLLGAKRHLLMVYFVRPSVRPSLHPFVRTCVRYDNWLAEHLSLLYLTFSRGIRKKLLIELRRIFFLFLYKWL